MATVTLGKSYFEALLRRAELHSNGQDLDASHGQPHNVTISKSEHDFLLQTAREYSLLKSALFRGGLTAETLQTLLAGEHGNDQDVSTKHATSTHLNNNLALPQPIPVHPRAVVYDEPRSNSDNNIANDGLQPGYQSHTYNRAQSFGQAGSSIDSPDQDDDHIESSDRLPIPDHHTILVANLSVRTTHKDIVSVARGGKLLDIVLRNDRTATLSFVDGAADFLAYTKRNDIYLHQKRLEFSWSDWQFRVPPHVSNKIANGATRNLVVRGGARKLTEDQIRDHLDHIHKLVVVDILFKNGDAYISTNSIHNALFARTCMMSRTAYKGLKIDWCRDECAALLPQSRSRGQTPTPSSPPRSKASANRYDLLDSGLESDTSFEGDTNPTCGINLNGHQWTKAVVA